MHIPEGAEETAKDLILQLRERGFQDDAEITEEVPVQQDKLTIVIPRESLTDTALENLQKITANKQTQGGRQVKQPVCPANILRFHRPQRVTDGFFVDQFSKVTCIPRKLYAKRPRARRLGLCGVGTRVIEPVPPENTPCAFGVIPQKKSRNDQKQCGEPGRDKIEQVVKPGGGTAEEQVTIVFVTDHTVHGVDRLVKEAERRAAHKHKAHGGDDAVAQIFRHRFHCRLGHASETEVLGVPPDNAGNHAAGTGQVPLHHSLINQHAFLF